MDETTHVFRDGDNYVLSEDGKFTEFTPEEVKALTSLYLENAIKNPGVGDELKITYGHPDGKTKMGVAIYIDPETEVSNISNFIELENGDIQDICTITPMTKPSSGVLVKTWQDELRDTYTRQEFISTYAGD